MRPRPQPLSANDRLDGIGARADDVGGGHCISVSRYWFRADLCGKLVHLLRRVTGYDYVCDVTHTWDGARMRACLHTCADDSEYVRVFTCTQAGGQCRAA